MRGFGGGSGWQFMKTRGFLTRGFAISGFQGRQTEHRREGEFRLSRILSATSIFLFKDVV